MRCIILPNGNRIGIGKYVKAWKALKAMPPDTEVAGWEWYPMKARDILRAISAGVQDRINQRVPYSERGLS